MLGQTNNGKIIVVIVALLCSSILVYGNPVSTPSIKKVSLVQAFSEINGWQAGKHIPFDKQVVESLHLDDYLNRSYRNGEKEISLYIGYYLTSGKIGAAHDPLVCFPGQGWNVSARKKGTLNVEVGARGTVKYSVMTVERGMDKSIILYWFQSYDFANADTFTQKVNLLWQKILGKGADNAFVRISCATVEKYENQCLEVMEEFTGAFYPLFLEYVRE